MDASHVSKLIDMIINKLKYYLQGSNRFLWYIGLILAMTFVVHLVVSAIKPSSADLPNHLDGRQDVLKIEQDLKSLSASIEVNMSNSDWDKSRENIKRILNLDPLNFQQLENLNRVNREEKWSEIYTEGDQYFKEKKYLEAMSKLVQIGPESSYSPRVRAKLLSIKRILDRKYREQGTNYLRKRKYLLSFKAFCNFFHLNPDDISLKKKMNWLKRRLSKRNRRCPEPEFPAVSVHEQIEVTDKSAILLKHKYPEQEIFKVMSNYAQGDVESAIRLLQKGREKARSLHRITKLDSFFEKMNSVKGKYTLGHSLILQNKLEEAARQWKEMLQIDRALMSEKVTSFYRQEIYRILVNSYYKKGQAFYQKERYKDAFNFWFKGYEINKDDINILNGLNKLEKVAQRYNKIAQQLKQRGDGNYQYYFKAAKEITLPESSVH